jgi:hypothetical protein
MEDHNIHWTSDQLLRDTVRFALPFPEIVIVNKLRLVVQRKIHNEELQSSYSSPKTIRVSNEGALDGPRL